MPIRLARNRDKAEFVPINPKALACHTAVIAQSGSGKSFMVGRLIEELLINTKAHVVILDPNSDFVRLTEVDETVWDESGFQPLFYPGDTLEAFRDDWKRVEQVILSNRNLASAKSLLINWGRLSDAERADVLGMEPTAEAELFWSLVLAGEVAQERWTKDQRSGLEPEYDFEYFRSVANEVCEFLLGGDAESDVSQRSLALKLRQEGPTIPLRLRTLIERLEAFEVWRPYGSGEKDVAEALLLQPAKSSVTVIDLLSLRSSAERLAITTRVLDEVWTKAQDDYNRRLLDETDAPDDRMPTFVVIDEAHNVAPLRRDSSAAERLASQIIRIAAEGRKFGLFLVVVTQRPRKLDSNVLSECDSLLLMRMTNHADVGAASELFGFLGAKVASEAQNLRIGEVFMQGRLGSSETVWHVSPRRTKQGGRSLDDAYWTTPYSAPADLSPSPSEKRHSRSRPSKRSVGTAAK